MDSGTGHRCDARGRPRARLDRGDARGGARGSGLVALDWDAKRGDLFYGIGQCDGQVLTVAGDHEGWEFDIRFPEHASLSRFKRYCEDHDIEFIVRRIYAATVPRADASFGMTDRQRETVEFAVRAGYYDVPRRCR